MKRIICLVLASLLLTSAEAQVSVRRTSRKTQKIEAEAEKITQRQTQRATATPPETPRREAVTPEEPTPVRKTTPVTKKTQAQRSQSATNIEGMSLRRQLFEQNRAQESYANRWQRVIYRELDLTKDVNAVLYYPEEPTDGLTNFFSVLFAAFVKGDLKAYEYIDGRELLDETHQVKVQDILETHDIDPADVPCYQVLSYYIKEQWDFDRNTSQYDSHIVAICPILHRPGEFGGISRYPLFWLKYDDLRPFIMDKLVMSSGTNTAVRYSIDDYFTLRKYEGEIYKVQNTRGLTLQQQYPDEAQLAAKREEIERELKSFGDSIWVPQEKAETTLPVKVEETPDSVRVSKARKRLIDADNKRSVKRNRRTKEALQ